MAQKEEETEYVFHIDDDVEIDCTIGGVETKMLIDSGCKQNLITKATWETLKKNKVILNNQHPNPNVTFMAYVFWWGKRACEPPEGRWSSPPSDTHDPRDVTSALPASRVGIGYLMEWADIGEITSLLNALEEDQLRQAQTDKQEYFSIGNTADNCEKYSIRFSPTTQCISILLRLTA
ncbi:hypothetical protein EVAR_38389_1 [Eumeta japonica]|uniref:Uncharacterized protein n=1 Tax=Eumeta variegata TaxID=151549 RepID=A0A4C1YGN6_EUMVA|nr:hypothetical protein EVAR_38389_1 [Eumeta japonica]